MKEHIPISVPNLDEPNQIKGSIFNVVEILNKWNEASDGYIKLLPQFHFCPVLMGSDDKPVALYEFIEVIDSMLDYSKIQEQYPNLSFAQIDGAISFLRKIAQFNILGVDFDDLEDEMLIENEESLEELRQALADEEQTRVLNFSE